MNKDRLQGWLLMLLFEGISVGALLLGIYWEITILIVFAGALFLLVNVLIIGMFSVLLQAKKGAKQGTGKKRSIREIVVIALLVICAGLVVVFLMTDDGNTGGDGITTCRNCGREKPLSAWGYCSTCQEGFDEWQQEEYEKEHYVPK